MTRNSVRDRRLIAFECAHCRRRAEKPTGHVNRSRSQGMRLFCGRTCAGLARRKWKSREQLVAEKRDYDAKYRESNAAMLKAKKAAYHVATYDPATAAIARRKRAPQHAEYCRRPEYKAYKSGYDKKRRASEYGPASDAYMVFLDLNREIKERMSGYEIKRQNGTFGKRQSRAREAEGPQGTRDRNRTA